MKGNDGYATKGRTEMLRFLEANADREVEASEIYDYLTSKSIKISMSTISMYLKRLVARGAVFKNPYDENGKTTFQYIEGRRGCCSHLHLRCRKCGRIQHLDCVFMKDVLNHIKEDHGFVVNCGNSMINGLCRDCAAQEQAWLNAVLEECKHCEDNPDNEEK